MSASNLIAEVPAHWASAVRPFLQRADEFQAREPLVSYFLRTHVAFLCMQKRTKEDKEGTKFLMKLLDVMEEEKKALGNQLDGVDGRTILTKIALMLFARGDDEERTGKSSLSIVRIFYTSAILFEATEQFTDDGKMDPVAAEKCKYAKYIAAKMKKALDNGQPYVSPNKIEAPLNDEEKGDGAGAGPNASPGMTTAPPSAYIPKQPSGNYAPPPGPPPQQPQQQPLHARPSAPPDDVPPSYTQTTRPNPSAPAPPSQMSNADIYRPPASTFQPKPQPPYPQPQQQQQQQQQPMPSPGRPAAPQPAYTPSTTGHVPTPDEMIDAQRNARQAVSALQFYDHKTARAQLIAALNTLDGKK